MLYKYNLIQNRYQLSDQISHNSWINLVNPTPEEIDEIVNIFDINKEMFVSILDPKERSRLSITEDNAYQTLIFNASTTQIGTNNKKTYKLVPVSIIILPSAIITVSLEKLDYLEELTKIEFSNKQQDLQFVLKILYQIVLQFITHIDEIDQRLNEIESRITLTAKNRYIVELLNIEKSLVYFTTNIDVNVRVLNKFYNMHIGEFSNPQIKTLYNNTVIELQQVQEMSQITSTIVRSVRDAYETIISNNLNKVMKYLTGLTLILTVPTIIFSFFGMNVPLGPQSDFKYTLGIILGTIIISIIMFVNMKRKDMF